MVLQQMFFLIFFNCQPFSIFKKLSLFQAETIDSHQVQIGQTQQVRVFAVDRPSGKFPEFKFPNVQQLSEIVGCLKLFLEK